MILSGHQNNKGCNALIFRCSGKSGYSAEVSGHPQRVEARKLEREVLVRFTDVPCIVRTPEGAVHAHPGDAVLTGNGGHHWRGSDAKIEHQYRPGTSNDGGDAGRSKGPP